MSDETRPGAAGRRKPRLLDRVRQSIRARHYSPRTEKAYVYWIKQFIFFHGKRHPKELGADEIRAFLNYLAVERKVSASTQNQARNALLFLYKNVLDLELEWLDDVVQAKGPVAYRSFSARPRLRSFSITCTARRGSLPPRCTAPACDFSSAAGFESKTSTSSNTSSSSVTERGKRTAPRHSPPSSPNPSPRISSG